MSKKLSPSIYRNRHPDKPMDVPSIVDSVQRLKNGFIINLSAHLLNKYTRDFYHEKTREIDCEAHDMVKEQSKESMERFMSRIELLLAEEWNNAERETEAFISELKKVKHGANDEKI